MAKTTHWQANGVFTIKSLWQPLLEIGFGVYTAFCLYVATRMFIDSPRETGITGLAGIPFLLVFCSGYLYVGFGTLYALWKMHQQQHAATSLPASV